MKRYYRKKWRPSLTMIVVGVLLLTLSLPLAGLFFFRFFENQLLRETERELIAQAAVVAAVMANQVEASGLPVALLGQRITPKSKDGSFSPALPQLDLSRDPVLPPRPEARATDVPVAVPYLDIGQRLSPIVAAAQTKTLAGFRILDPGGNIITGKGDLGLSLAHVGEVKAAMTGDTKSVIRERITDSPQPPIASVSRGTGIRIFLAMPVITNNRVAGIIYLSRTPSNVLKELFNQRWKLASAGVVILGAVFAIAFIFIRAIKNPIESLKSRTLRMSNGDREALKPLDKHGSRELAELSASTMKMADTLFNRADYIDTFASHVSHELKSPLTSISGAAELLRDQSTDMSEEERARFLGNILEDSRRMVMLLERLRELARADNPTLHGQSGVQEVFDRLSERHQELRITLTGAIEARLPMAMENAMIVFSNLIENAIHHEATEIEIETLTTEDATKITISDNGNGVSDENANKIFDLFFTTRRGKNGTGMGLGIVQAMLKAHHGSIRLAKPKLGGASFEITLPRTENT